MSSGPAEIMAAIAAGLATVTNLSAARVSLNDWTIQNQPYSALVFPSLGGSQELSGAGSWLQAHRIKVRLRIRDNNPQALYTKSAAMIPLVLAWFRSNDSLGLADVLTCHMESAPLTWDSPTGDAVLDDGNGVLSKEIEFAISVQVTL
jgi:hypothetical protein